MNDIKDAKDWKITLLYDGQCPLCVREVNFLRKQDRDRGLVKFVDVMADTYNPEHYAGVTFAAAMDRIHGILPDGTVLKNVAVFRSVYQALGMGWVYGITQIPLIGAIADFIYGIWAKYRLQLTGRPDLITLIQEREQRLNCKDQGCAVVRE
jgi:predicted DCC family thiol-disulfide oxidoreductase YuxK